MKGLPRSPVPPPTRVERDRRWELSAEADEDEVRALTDCRHDWHSLPITEPDALDIICPKCGTEDILMPGEADEVAYWTSRPSVISPGVFGPPRAELEVKA